MQYFARFQLTARSRGPSAIAGLLVLNSGRNKLVCVICIMQCGGSLVTAVAVVVSVIGWFQRNCVYVG